MFLFVLVSFIFIFICSSTVNAEFDFSNITIKPFFSDLDYDIDESILNLALCYELQDLSLSFKDYYLLNKDVGIDKCNSFLDSWDSDGDWFGNEDELNKGSDPNNQASIPIIDQIDIEEDANVICDNGDGICLSEFEEACFDFLDGKYDSDCMDEDRDGFPTYVEILQGTDPHNFNSVPWWIDLDNDGYFNLDELRSNSDPLDNYVTIGWSDSDRDGYADAVELNKNTDPNNPNDFPSLEDKFPTLDGSKPTLVDDVSDQDQIFVDGAGLPDILSDKPILDNNFSFNKFISRKSFIIVLSIIIVVVFLLFVFKKLAKYKKKSDLAFEKLLNLITSYRSKGYSFNQIRAGLIKFGNPEKLVDKAIKKFARKN